MNSLLSWQTFGVLLGGLGLFLVGMHLMTEGLTCAAGPGLRVVLAKGTKTPLRGVLSGVVLTSLVHASAAVTITTIGFVNAGLMTLRQAVTVIYGSNVGTTVTAWLVALVGINFDLKAVALPLIGVGMLLRVTAARSKWGAVGEAAAGFGLFFLGIELLKATFADFGVVLAGQTLPTDGVFGVLFFLALGFAMTVLMQSSSAAIAVVLTASGLLPVASAAAMVIGANVGTTTTAALSVIGATPNAKRTAAAHVGFNLITGAVALILLPWLVDLIVEARALVGLDSAPAPVLAAFHTMFNILGVALLWPLTPRFVAVLEGWFRTAEEDEARPKYLDRHVVAAPALALHALALEITRIGEIVRRMGQGALSTELTPGARLAADKAIVERLVDAVGDYSQQLQAAKLSEDAVAGLEKALRVVRYHSEQAELAQVTAEALSHLPPLELPILADEGARFRAAVVNLLGHASEPVEQAKWGDLDAEMAALQKSYQTLKSHYLRAGAEARLPVRRMVDYLDAFSNIRRLAEQAYKAADHFRALGPWLTPTQPEPPSVSDPAPAPQPAA